MLMYYSLSFVLRLLSCRLLIITSDVCRLQIVDGKDEAILCEGNCKQWYHRGCASLPPERYKELSASKEPFTCLVCTCLSLKKEVSLLSSAVITLREELRDALKVKESVNALEKEVSALKEYWKEASSQLEEAKRAAAKQEPRSYANAVNGGSYATTRVTQRAARKAAQKPPQHRSRPSNAPAVTSRGENGSEAASTDGSAQRRRSTTARELVSGARRVWGTLPLITCTTVKNTISRLTNSSSMPNQTSL